MIGSPGDISARIERLPMSWWHHRLRAVAAVAHFFDAFDALAIASVLPVLVVIWKLSPAEAGALISIGYVGQAIGSTAFGLAAQRWGRIRTTLFSVVLFALLSLACGFATSYAMLFVLRFLQGIGLGGEQPVMHAYMNEMSKAKGRARFILLPSLGFSVGVAAAAYAGRWIVPEFGWQVMFLIGAVPAFVIIPLRVALPESPRWLASIGRFEQADAVMQRIERAVSRDGKIALPEPIPVALPPTGEKGRVRDLLRGPYRRRTLVVWSIFFSAYFIGYGVTNWMPTLYTTVYKLKLEQALTFGAITTSCSLIGSVLVTFLIDRTGRRAWFSTSLLAAAAIMLALSLLDPRAPYTVLALVSLAALMVNPVCISIGVYAAENYPTALRAIGTGIGSSWIRIAAIIAPFLIGLVLPVWGMVAVFAMFAIVGLAGGLVTLRYAIETANRTLEELSPPPEGARS